MMVGKGDIAQALSPRSGLSRSIVDPGSCNVVAFGGADITIQQNICKDQVLACVGPFEKSVFIRVCWPCVGHALMVENV